jgi:arylsulfatase A-like enzyme
MADRPHLVLLTADQMRFDCLSAYGKLGVRTPNLDALAAESVVFDRAYCSTPLCIPTRTSLATGRWPHTTRCITNGGRHSPAETPWRFLGPETPTFYERAAGAGYRITHVGIQHVYSDPPLRERVPSADFVEALDHERHMEGLGVPANYQTDQRVPVLEFDNGRNVVLPRWASPRIAERFPHPPEHFKDLWFARQMEQRIAACDPSQPQAFVFQAWAPHPPLFVPEPWDRMYDPAAIDLPENVGRWHPDAPATLLLGTAGIRASQVLRDEWRPVWAAYFGLVTMVDECLGRVIRALKAKGIWDDAVVVFTMDHGEHLGSRRLCEKMTMYEESAHVPLFVRAPGAKPGRRAPPVGHVDLAPTLCDYAGAKPLGDAWGRSLRALVDDPAAPWRDATFSEFHGDHGRGFPQRAVVTDRYKYVHHFCAHDELYDLREDPNETRSLAADPAQAKLRGELRARLRDWMRATDDFLDLERHASFTPADWARLDRQRGWLQESHG